MRVLLILAINTSSFKLSWKINEAFKILVENRKKIYTVFLMK